MGDRLVAIALPERRNKSRGVIEQFNSHNVSQVPVEYRPILDILQTYFSIKDARSLDSMPIEQRHRVIEAILRRIQAEQEGLQLRQSAGTESIATNAFLMNRLYYLKEVVAALLGNGTTPESVDEMMARGERVVCRSMAPLELRRPTNMVHIFSALQYLLTGPEGEARWREQTNIDNVSLLALACRRRPEEDATAIGRLYNLYWGIILRGIPPTLRDLRRVPNIQAILAPVFDALRARYTAGNLVFDTVHPALEARPAAFTIENALRLYVQRRDNLSALLQYLRARTVGEATAAGDYRGGPLDVCRLCGVPPAPPAGAPLLTPAMVSEATALIVALLFEKMLRT